MTLPLLSLAATGPRRLAGAALHPVLDALTANPWASLVEMSPDTRHLGGLQWRTYDRDEAVLLLAGSDAVFVRESAAPDAVDAQLFDKVEDATNAVLYLPASRTFAEDPRLRAHIARVLATLPGGYASIFHTQTREPYPSDRLPPPLHRAPWLAALSRGYYERWFDRDALLAAPAASVTEAADGTIWLQLYRTLVSPTVQEMTAAYAYLETVVRG